MSAESIDDAETVTIDGTTFYIGDLYYTGESYSSSDYYTTLTSEQTTVSVKVDLVTDGYGNILISGLTISDTNNTASMGYDDLSEDSTAYAVVSLSDGENIREITDSDLASMTESGLYVSYIDSSESTDGEADDSSGTYLLPSGYYTVTVTFYRDIDGDDESEAFATGTAENVSVRPSQTTTVTGDTLEVTVEAELDEDVNVTYDTYEVSTADDLIAYLALDGATVTLTSDITASDTTLTISNDTTIDLGTCSLSAASITVEDGASLTITGDSEDDSSGELTTTIELGDGSSLSVDGVTLTSSGTYLVSSDYGDVDITISDSTLTTTESGRGIYVMVDDDNSKDTTLSITLSNTTIHTQSSSSRGISIHGSESDSSSSNLSKLELNISGTVIDSTEDSSSVQCLAIYKVEEVQISISGSSFICDNNQYAFYLYNSGNSETQSIIDISSTTLQGYNAFYGKYTTNVEVNITGSSLLGYNYNNGSSSRFSTIALQYPIDTVINVEDSTVAFMEYGTSEQAMAGITYVEDSVYTGNRINFTDCDYTFNNAPEDEEDSRIWLNIENLYEYTTDSETDSDTLGDARTDNYISVEGTSWSSSLETPASVTLGSVTYAIDEEYGYYGYGDYEAIYCLAVYSEDTE